MSFKLTNYDIALIIGQLGNAAFIDGDANMNNSRRLKGIYPSVDVTAIRFSRGRKRIRFKAFQQPWTKTDIPLNCDILVINCKELKKTREKEKGEKEKKKEHPTY
jgi:hypothetical protein